jgi:hypothetical protein
MEKISLKLRRILRKLFVVLGVVVMPFAIHAAYGMRDDDGPRNTPVRGTVRSQAGEPIAGITVRITGQNLYFHYGYDASTDDEGNFIIDMPERESYDIFFVDTDGELNGGFFRHDTRTISLSDTNNPLNFILEGESDVTIRGVVRSDKSNETIPGIQLSIHIPESDITFRTLTDNNGNFSIRVPERESYNVVFVETARNDLFIRKTEEFALDEIKNPLNVILQEEKFVTIRGVVCSANTGKPADGITVRIYNRAVDVGTERYLRGEYRVFTNDEGYFEIRIPERSSYRINFDDHDRNRFYTINDDEMITLPAGDTVLTFKLRER